MTRRRESSIAVASRTKSFRWQTAEAQAWFAEHLRRWSADPHVLAVIAVGSAVRHVAKPSDADFVIIWQSKRPDVTRAPIELDLRLYERSRAEALIAQGHDYLSWAVRLGRLVHEKGDFWRQFKQQWFDAAPWPDANDAEQRAQRAARYSRDLAAAGDLDAAHEQSVSELTHRARAALLRARVFPHSRPELPAQLREVHEDDLADKLEQALTIRSDRARS